MGNKVHGGHIFILLLIVGACVAEDQGKNTTMIMCSLEGPLMLENNHSVSDLKGFTVDSMTNLTLCTHLVFQSRAIQRSIIQQSLHRQDNNTRLTEGTEVLAYIRKGEELRTRKPELKLLIDTEITSRLVETASMSRIFIVQSVEFLKKNKLDGMVLRCFPVNNNATEKCVNLISDLSKEMSKDNLSLTVFLPIEESNPYDDEQLVAIEKCSNFILIEASARPAACSNITKLINPFPGWESPFFWYAVKKIPFHKMVIPFSLSTYSYKLKDIAHSGAGAATSSTGENSDDTRTGPFSIVEVIKMMREDKDNWKVMTDAATTTPYAVHTTGAWASFENLLSIDGKAIYITDLGLGGVMIMPIEASDWRGELGNGDLPIIRRLHSHLTR